LQRALQNAFYTALWGSGLDLLLRPLMGGVGSILVFHRLVTEPPTGTFGPSRSLSITADGFRALITYLRRAGIEIVSLNEVLRRLQSGETGRRFTCLTFDDGYRDNYELLYPICKELEAPFTVYVTTDLIDGKLLLWWYGLEATVARNDTVTWRANGEAEHYPAKTPDEKARTYRALDVKLRHASAERRAEMIAMLETDYCVDFKAESNAAAMSWEMVRELAASDLAEIGGHTVTHPALKTLSDDEARREITEGCRIIESHTKQEIRHFAYPFGRPSDVSDRDRALCRELGFATATTTRTGILETSHKATPHDLPRISVTCETTPQRLRVDMSGVPAKVRTTIGGLLG
jgi:peptidoglycan/xylan/chitin deacetylase (PgdA/CDA1 family)